MSKHQIQSGRGECISRLPRDGTVECVSRDQLIGRERRQGINYFSCSADQEHDWQPYPVGPFSAIFNNHIVMNR